jgi:hypothetical protein
MTDEEMEFVVEMELRDWYVSNNGYTVSGYVYNDSKRRFENGSLITTSAITEWIPDASDPVAIVTKNSRYALGNRLSLLGERYYD